MGGMLLSFAGTRTHHRMTVNIEDAGFEIRDMIAWVYGSGFPKSLNIGKAVDKLHGNEREVIGLSSSSRLNASSHHNNVGGNPHGNSGMVNITRGNSEFEGWGTALKPALEPITVARKPLSEKTVAENVLKHGTGGINIDACRIETCEIKIATKKRNGGIWQSKGQKSKRHNGSGTGNAKGRFPANLIHDGSDEVTGLFPNRKQIDKRKFKKGINCKDKFFKGKESIQTSAYGDTGSASRFFYCSKASKKERGKGNNHPTVKPLALMEYLITLVTPKDGIVLDPFAGSGTTAVACEKLGIKYICITDELEHCEIIKSRIEKENEQLKLF